MSRLSSTVTISTITKVLLLLTLVTGLVTVVGNEVILSDQDKVSYSTERTNQTCDMQFGSDDRANATTTSSQSVYVLYYDNLSEKDQDIFISAIQADDEYVTNTLPDEFLVETDTEETNYVQYNSACYKLKAVSERNPNAPLYAIILRIIGGGLSAIFAIATVVSFLWTRVRQYRNGV